MNLIQAQQRYIEKMKAIPIGCGKKQAVGARLELCRWAKRNGCDPIVVLNRHHASGRWAEQALQGAGKVRIAK